MESENCVWSLQTSEKFRKRQKKNKFITAVTFYRTYINGHEILFMIKRNLNIKKYTHTHKHTHTRVCVCVCVCVCLGSHA